MVSAVIREDALTQYLLGFALVAIIVGSIGGLAHRIHFGYLTVPYLVTVIAVAVVFLSLAGLSVYATRNDAGASADAAEQTELSASEAAAIGEMPGGNPKLDDEGREGEQTEAEKAVESGRS